MKTRWWVVVAAVVATGCGDRPAVDTARAADPASPRTVAVEAVADGKAGTSTVPAVVRARERATLSARAPGAVVALPFREGQRVPAGAVVARLEDAALRAGLGAAEAALESAEADARRAETLLARGAATTQEAEHAVSRRAAARAAVQAAREQHSYAVLRAPFAGTVAARRSEVGDVVSPGTALLELEGDGVLEIVATVDATQAAGLAPGTRLGATVDGGNERLEATVVALSRTGDPSTHRFEVRAQLPALSGLRSGVFARLHLEDAATTASTSEVTVPARAVFSRGGLSGVFVVEGDAARLRWIAAGTAAGDRVSVRAGLVAGERVILDPAGLHDGAPVRVAR